jgi:hypothetical protein
MSISTRLAHRLLIAAVVAGAAAASAPAVQAATVSEPTLRPAGATTQGIIMRDGGVCDPIRHMGC